MIGSSVRSTYAPSEAPASGAYRIRGFDGLRAIAVFLVFLHHNTRFGSDLDLGRFGVWLFFVLSGFLIIGILHAARVRIEKGAALGGELRTFFKRRSLRIFPVYYLTLAVTVPLALLTHRVDFTGAAMMATYTANIWMGRVLGHWSHFSHLWSLSIEEQFYLFAAVLFLVMPARRHSLLCLALMTLSLASQLVMVARHALGIAIYTDSLFNFGIIALGGAAFLLCGPAPRPGRSSIAGVVLLGLFLGSAAVGMAFGRIATDLPLATVALLLASLFRNQASGLVAALEFAPLRWFGRISYGFYLFHAFLGTHEVGSVARWAGLHLADDALVLLPVSFAASVTAATASWWLIERPIQNFGRRRTSREPSRA